MQQPPRQCRRTARRCRSAFDHPHRPATTRQRMRAGTARQPGPDHDGRTHSPVGQWGLMAADTPARRVAAGEHLALAGVTRPQVKLETCCLQRGTNRLRGRIGRQRGARARASSDRLEQRGLPHLGIAGGRKSVQENRIGTEDELRQEFTRVAERECQAHSAAVEFQPVQSGHRQRPLSRQCLGQRPEIRRRHREQICRRQRVLLDRNEMQTSRPLRVRAARPAR